MACYTYSPQQAKANKDIAIKNNTHQCGLGWSMKPNKAHNKESNKAHDKTKPVDCMLNAQRISIESDPIEKYVGWGEAWSPTEFAWQ